MQSNFRAQPSVRRGRGPFPFVLLSVFARSFYFFLLLHLAASSVRRSGFDCCRCSLIVLHWINYERFLVCNKLVKT